MVIEKTAQAVMTPKSKNLAQRELCAFSRARGPILESRAAFDAHYNCAESLLLLYGVVTKLTNNKTKGFRTCKALPPSSPNSYLSSRVICFVCYLRSIRENVRIDPFLDGTNSSTFCISNWPDVKAFEMGSWA